MLSPPLARSYITTKVDPKSFALTFGVQFIDLQSSTGKTSRTGDAMIMMAATINRAMRDDMTQSLQEG